jgi:hypothetical protein
MSQLNACSSSGKRAIESDFLRCPSICQCIDPCLQARNATESPYVRLQPSAGRGYESGVQPACSNAKATCKRQRRRPSLGIWGPLRWEIGVSPGKVKRETEQCRCCCGAQRLPLPVITGCYRRKSDCTRCVDEALTALRDLDYLSRLLNMQLLLTARFPGQAPATFQHASELIGEITARSTIPSSWKFASVRHL